MALHTFIVDQRPVSTLASRFRWFQMIAHFLKRSPAQDIFSFVVFEKLVRIDSTPMSLFHCILWNSLVQLTTSYKPRAAVKPEADAIALMDFAIVKLLNESFVLTRQTVSLDYDAFSLRCQSRS